MRGKALLFPPQSGFTYWFPPDHIKKQLALGILGREEVLQQRATCRMCGKIIKRGERARADFSSFDHLRHGLRGYIHAEQCIPLIAAIFGHMQDGKFVESIRITTDNMDFTEGFYSHSLEEARSDIESLLDNYWNGVFELCYIELDGVRHPEPIYSETYKRTVVMA